MNATYTVWHNGFPLGKLTDGTPYYTNLPLDIERFENRRDAEAFAADAMGHYDTGKVSILQGVPRKEEEA